MAAIYNTVSGKFIGRNLSSSLLIELPALGAAIIVSLPAGGKITYEGEKMLVDGIVVDYKFQGKK